MYVFVYVCLTVYARFSIRVGLCGSASVSVSVSVRVCRCVCVCGYVCVCVRYGTIRNGIIIICRDRNRTLFWARGSCNVSLSWTSYTGAAISADVRPRRPVPIWPYLALSSFRMASTEG